MESTLTKQVRHGKSCVRCKSYFVTEEENAHMCPWCDKIEKGVATADPYEPPERPDE
jgi:rRNA maturation endonuclease Nob1